ncbi:Zn-ribbon domain-containing OB-fold protein [Diaphorobacter sp. HDW4A]|uniref:Zn-ribbon domain-containing OB-fold protein n=1 Tax=Diaphorobacter sp. HDW4A TaxID=2714924 RepID=UPI00140A5A71|nr:Zn-ribbon domain-containing OB-fold protein [Diaphorobacter sp. HDW4A]QIL79910.1 Zn-ribbon domain-containing OB-fold protein [Diaphorobacter sp. HDW4A]
MTDAAPTESNVGAPQSAAASACDKRYFDALAQGRFEIPQCRDCGKFHFYPRVCCPHCGSQALDWVAPSGDGTVYSVTIVRAREGADYTVVLVNLDEGPRLMSRVVDMPVDEVRIGMPVRARIDVTDEGPLLVFVARGGAA